MIPRHSILLLWLLFKGIAYPFNEVHKNLNINGKYLVRDIETEKKPGRFDAPDRKGKGNYYIDCRTGKYLGRDGDSSSPIEEVRVIRAKKYYDVCKVYSKKNGGDSVVLRNSIARKELKNNSSVIDINDQFINREIDSVDMKTRHSKKEHQIYIVLKIDTTQKVPKAQVTCIRGPEGTTTGATVQAFFYEGAWRPSSDSGTILLGQVHGHPLAPAPFENKSGTSNDDRRVARNYGIYIYSIDSYRNTNVWISRVTPAGDPKPAYCPLNRKESIGMEALELFVGK